MAEYRDPVEWRPHSECACDVCRAMDVLADKLAEAQQRNDQLVRDGQHWLTVGRENDELREKLAEAQRERDDYYKPSLAAAVEHFNAMKQRAEAAEKERDELYDVTAHMQNDILASAQRAEAAEAREQAAKVAEGEMQLVLGSTEFKLQVALGALEFYADPKNWEVEYHGYDKGKYAVAADGGEHAREALDQSITPEEVKDG